MAMKDIIVTAVILGLLLLTVILSHERGMETESVLDRMDRLEERLSELEVKNLPTVNVARGSVYTGDGRVVIQGFDEED